MTVSCCFDCLEEPTDNCRAHHVVQTDDLRTRWHGFPASCQETSCIVCDCDCDHCCFGYGTACEDADPEVVLVKTCLYPVAGRMQRILKSRIKVSRRDLESLDLLFQLAQAPGTNRVPMAAILSEFPVFEFMSNDSGITITDLIRKHPHSQAILDDLWIGR